MASIDEMLSELEIKLEKSFHEDFNPQWKNLEKTNQNEITNQPVTHSNEQSTSYIQKHPKQKNFILKATNQQNINNTVHSSEMIIPQGLEDTFDSAQAIPNSGTDHDNDGSYYKDLSLKLQRALLKISSDRRLANESMFSRFQQYQLKKSQLIEQKRQLLEQQRRRELRGTPLINENSRMMVQKQAPIYQRVDEIVEAKKRKQQELQEKRIQSQQQKLEQEEQVLIQVEDRLKQKYQNVRSSQQYYQAQQKWAQIKQKNLEDKAKQLDKQKLEQYTFKPSINHHSIKINKKIQRVPIYEREVTVQKVYKDQNCTFKPKINKR